MPGISKTVAAENPATTPLTGSELIRIVQAGDSKRTTAQDIANLFPLPLSVKGQILIHGTSGIEAQSVGTDGFFLAADSTQETGLNYLQGVLASNLADASNGKGADLVGGVGRVVSTMTALRTLSKTGVGRAFATGNLSQGDGGGGQYYYDASDTTSADNGGSIIVAGDGGRWKLIHFGFVTPEQFGVIGDGAAHTNNAAAFQAMIDWAAPLGVKIYLNGKTYVVTPFQSQSGAANYNTAMVMKSGLHIIGHRGGSIKISDNYSTDASPKELAMFSTVNHIGNVTFEGVVFDMNGANNSMSPGRPTTYNQFNHAAVMVDGATGFVDDMIIDKCIMKNTAGVCFVVAQLVAVSTAPALGLRWKITDNLFLNGGLDTNDHTSIYAWCEDMYCAGNTFWEDSPPHTVGKTGGATCYEVHGSHQRFVNNYCYNYTLGTYIAPNFTNTTLNTIVQGNHIYCSDYGILLWRASALGYLEVKGVLIEDNTFYFDSYTYSGQPLYKACIAYQGQIATVQGAINNVTISGNYGVSTSTTLQTQFLHFDSSTTAGNVCNNWKVTDNQTVGMTDSVSIITNSASGLGLMEISRNQFLDGNTDSLSNPPHGVYINAAGAGISTLVMNDNVIVDSRGGSAQMNTAIYFAGGTITTMSLGNQTMKGMTAANVNNAGSLTTFTNMIGCATDIVSATVADGGTISFNGNFTNFVPRHIEAAWGTSGDIVTIDQPYVANTATVRIKNWSGGVKTSGSTQPVKLKVSF